MVAASTARSFALKWLLAFLGLASIGVGQSGKEQSHDWKSCDWSGSSKELVAVQKKIADEVTKTKGKNTPLGLYERAATAKRDDLVANFRWGYCAYRVSLFDRNVANHQLVAAKTAMLKVKAPFPLEYSRLLFLMEATYTRNKLDAGLRKAGRRVLKLSPNDQRVLVQLSKLLSYGTNLDDKREAARMMDKVVLLEPSYPGNHYSAGMRYIFIYHANKERPAAIKARAYFEKYLKMTERDPDLEYVKKSARAYVKELNYFLNK